MLRLGHNKIGDEGAQHLARAFENNNVGFRLYLSCLFVFSHFHTDTHRVGPQLQ
jgi:hypothetical protein